MNLDRAQVALTAAVAATCLISIFAAQIALALAVLVWLARLALGRTRRVPLPLDGPVLAFAVWTLLSASFSGDPVGSIESAKKLVLFLLLYVAVDALRAQPARERILDAALLGGIVLAGGAIAQYYLLGFDTANNRPHSFLGHYMTASGLLMGVLVLAAARLAFRGDRLRRPTRDELRVLGALALGILGVTALQAADLFAVEAERVFVFAFVVLAMALASARGPWPASQAGALLAALAFGLSSWALLLSRTRNAWLGAIAGLMVVGLLRAPRLLWVLAVAVAAVLVLRPAPVMDRLTLRDDSSKDRIYMWQAGLDMIRDKPVFGQGPGMILRVYPQYRWPEAPNPQAPHLHNNELQIAAERGLPCLAWFLWLISAAMADAWRETRGERRGTGWAAAAALAVQAAILVAGLFEYNFGDSEVLMFVLLVTALPYALRAERLQA